METGHWWRKYYDSLNYKKAQEFWKARLNYYIEAVTRHGGSYNLEGINEAFKILNITNPSVAELGGMAGQLAYDMIPLSNCSKWVNYEIFTPPQLIAKDQKYTHVELPDFFGIYKYHIMIYLLAHIVLSILKPGMLSK